MAGTRATKGEQLVLLACVVLVGSSFIPAWARHSIADGAGSDTVATNAWGHFGFIGNLALLVAATGAFLAILGLAGIHLDFHRSGLTYLVLIGAASMLLLLSAISGPQRGAPLERDDYRVQRGPLLYTGLGLIGIALYGASLHRLDMRSRQT